MPRLHIDIESYGTVDLTKVGVYKYAYHPDTRIRFISCGLDDGPISTPVRKGGRWPSRYADLSKIEMGAHNAEFERVMLNGPPGQRIGFPQTKIAQWVCTAAKAASHALPRDLESLLKALGLPQQIDRDKRKNMLKLSKPFKGREPTPEEFPREFEKWQADCEADVAGERAVDQLLPDLIPSERRLWILDQEINQRGFPVDMDSVQHIIQLRDEHINRLVDECMSLCGYNPTQRDAILGWLQSKGIDLPDMRAATVMENMHRDRVLSIRRETSKTSVAKFDAIVKCAGADNRVRGGHMFHGASPGRWTGKLVQTQNLPKPLIHWEVELADQIGQMSLETLRLLEPDTMDALSSAARPMIRAEDGKTLIVGDFSAVESRIVAWLVGEEWKLDIFRKGGSKAPIYEAVTARMFGCTVEFLQQWARDHGHHHDWRDLGKRTELMCGYAGGIAAVKRSPGFEKIDPQPSDEKIQEWVNLWREACPRTQGSWKGLEKLIIDAIETGAVQHGYRCRFGVVTYDNGIQFLRVQLPSKRSIYFPQPQVERKQVWWDEVKRRYVDREIEGQRPKVSKSISYMEESLTTHQWWRKTSHGGIFLQNITEAVGRDLLANGMIKLDDAGYPIIMHVHDEAVAEREDGQGSLEEFLALMTDKPEWAEGLPLDAAGYRARRYHKD